MGCGKSEGTRLKGMRKGQSAARTARSPWSRGQPKKLDRSAPASAGWASQTEAKSLERLEVSWEDALVSTHQEAAWPDLKEHNGRQLCGQWMEGTRLTLCREGAVAMTLPIGTCGPAIEAKAGERILSLLASR